MTIINPELQKARANSRRDQGMYFTIPILAIVTLVATLVLVYACCQTISLSNFMITRAFLDPTSRWIGISGFAVFGCLLIACEAKTGTFFSRCVVVPLAVFLEALVIDNYGITHVVWTFGFFISGSVYIVTCVRHAKWSFVYFLVVMAFLVAWLLRVGDGVVSALQLSTVVMLMLVITLHMFRAYARQLDLTQSQSFDAVV
jgi:hypothetical protein